MESIHDIRAMLAAASDEEYRSFQSKLIPTVDANQFLGVRTPKLRALAKQLARETTAQEFLNTLPHTYFEENQLHAFIISEMKDFDSCIQEVSRFLPYVDNWATCDQMTPRVFKRHQNELKGYIETWLQADRVYTLRFAIKMLMNHFLGESFEPKYAKAVAGVVSNEYYVKMMQAWYFATALAKNYRETLPFLESKALEKWTHNKAIQKAVESYRISDERKEYLRTLKIK